ncbi:MAG: class I SAM-dependent methyltransferase [Saprospiraceae bacterium]|nr:class I SAM-dependent methyltransferase [Saprospiraceae bacterium]
MMQRIKSILRKLFQHRDIDSTAEIINNYIKNGSVPWSKGYGEYKNLLISKSINDYVFLRSISAKNIPKNFGMKIDERIIEYPWIFSKLNDYKEDILDAGSTFNFDYVVNHNKFKNKDLTIFTFAPETNAFPKKRVSYVYGDLRDMPFENNQFDTVVSQSTIEHIDMDNSIYGYDIEHNENEEKKSYDYIKAVKEMTRVLKSKGTLLITFPFGKFENHGFFQQFDDEMLDRILNYFDDLGDYSVDFFKYEKDGWRFAERDELQEVVSYNPHSGKGKMNDGAAHCRSVACIHFIKY